MNYLDTLVKIISFKQKKQKASNFKNIAIFSALGVAITGVVVILVAQSCSKEIRNIVIKKANYMQNEINEDIEHERDEIKQTMESVDDESIGDVGLAMEDALEDLEDEKETLK